MQKSSNILEDLLSEIEGSRHNKYIKAEIFKEIAKAYTHLGNKIVSIQVSAGLI